MLTTVSYTHLDVYKRQRPIKGSWAVEGGGALISQAIHQVDLLLHPVSYTHLDDCRADPLAVARCPSRWG